MEKKRRSAVKNKAVKQKRTIMNAVRILPTATTYDSIENYGLSLYGVPLYPLETTKSEYKTFYKKHGLARRIVNIYPNGCWQEFPAVKEGGDPKESKFEVAWKKLVKNPKLKLPFNLLKADRLSGIGRFGVLFLGFDDGGQLHKPVKKAEKLLYLRSFDETSVDVDEVETDTSSERYGQPTKYSIKLQSTTNAETVRPLKVHWTRVLHIVEDTLESEVYGQPRLEGLVPRMLEVSLLLSGSTHMFMRGAFPGISFEADEDVDISDEDQIAMETQIKAYMESMARFLTLQGVKANPLEVQVASPAPYIKAQMEFIAETIGVPSRMLAGSEQAQLASEQDRANFDDKIRARQDNYVTPGIMLPFVERLQNVGVLPETKEPIVVEWVQTDLSSRKDEAEITDLRASAIAHYAREIGSPGVMGEKSFLKYILGLTPEEIAEIEKDKRDLGIKEASLEGDDEDEGMIDE